MLPPEVRRDPRRALDGGADGLDCYRTIAGQARTLLRPDGHLVVEIGIGQESGVAALFRSAGLAPAPARPDLSGIPRALCARVATITP
jgi:release factor glutamine methyltransferase